MGFRSLTIAFLLLSVAAIAAPAQADIWNYLPDAVIRAAGPSTCNPDDEICQITCGALYDFDSGSDGPTVDLPNRRVVIPGPGLEQQQLVIFGHWTICI